MNFRVCICFWIFSFLLVELIYIQSLGSQEEHELGHWLALGWPALNLNQTLTFIKSWRSLGGNLWLRMLSRSVWISTSRFPVCMASMSVDWYLVSYHMVRLGKKSFIWMSCVLLLYLRLYSSRVSGRKFQAIPSSFSLMPLAFFFSCLFIEHVDRECCRRFFQISYCNWQDWLLMAIEQPVRRNLNSGAMVLLTLGAHQESSKG